MVLTYFHYDPQTHQLLDDGLSRSSEIRILKDFLRWLENHRGRVRFLLLGDMSRMTRLASGPPSGFLPAVGNPFASAPPGRGEGRVFIIPVQLGPKLQIFSFFLFQFRF